RHDEHAKFAAELDVDPDDAPLLDEKRVPGLDEVKEALGVQVRARRFEALGEMRFRKHQVDRREGGRHRVEVFTRALDAPGKVLEDPLHLDALGKLGLADGVRAPGGGYGWTSPKRRSAARTVSATPTSCSGSSAPPSRARLSASRMSRAPRSPAEGLARRSARAAAVSSWSRSASRRSVVGWSASASSRPGANAVRSARRRRIAG